VGLKTFVITRFPAEELMVAAGGYQTVYGALPETQEFQSHLNRAADREPTPAANEPAGGSDA
jgi:hypothetical protein